LQIAIWRAVKGIIGLETAPLCELQQKIKGAGRKLISALCWASYFFLPLFSTFLLALSSITSQRDAWADQAANQLVQCIENLLQLIARVYG